MTKRIYEQRLKDCTIKAGRDAFGIVLKRLDELKPKQPHEILSAELNFTADELRKIHNSTRKP